ncbi:MAG: bile acid:sodium symporter family protein [Bacteroidales bacterium]
MNFIKSILLNRNFILILAVIAGLTIGDYAHYLKDYNIYILGVTMTFSMTGLDLRLINSFKKVLKPFTMGILLNYFVFGAIMLPLAWFLMPTKELFYGFVVIIAAPPGVAIIPFSHILKGRVDYAIIGVTGAFIASVFLAPFIVETFAKSEGIKSTEIFITMVKLVIVPLIIAQILRIKEVAPIVFYIRGRVVDFGFALIIFVAVGLNRQVFFTNPQLLALVVTTLALSIFGLGILHQFVLKKMGVSYPTMITQNMLTTIKSSGFSVFTALTLFGQKAAIPSAVLAVMVLLYLIFLSLRFERKK